MRLTSRFAQAAVATTMVLGVCLAGGPSLVAEGESQATRDHGDATSGDEPSPSGSGRTIRFAGRDWRVKLSGNNRVGPGPNYFSDSDRNVDVDSSGRLHMRIVHENGRWNCAEVISVESFGYGRYRFDLEEVPEAMNPRAVFGMFTCSDAPAYSHRELDVEISRWGNPENENAQFIVQPYTLARNVVRFMIPAGVRSSTHSFVWSPDSVVFESAGMARMAEATRVIKTHTFDRGIPRPGDENVRINLWLLLGRPPSDGKAVEVVVSDFKFSKQ